MAKRRANKTGTSKGAESESAAVSAPANTGGISRRKLWGFRLAAVVLIPAALFGVSELVLRLCGFGYRTAFLLPTSQPRTETLVQNNQFGWRFFGPDLARLPEPFAISRTKPPNTIRILVLGESAAKGEPQPAFGLPRMLQVILTLRHPEVRFEVINCSMTAINSHAIRAIARDCRAASADIWVIYMGNNEVVGPYGAGTVFGRPTPPLPLIRMSLALQSTRTGQALDSLLARWQPPGDEPEEWRGMKMFLEQQVAATDPRLSSVYHHFERNLNDVITTGHRSGAGIVVSTVAVNLRDCAPFAAVQAAGMSNEAKTNWAELYQRGIAAQKAGDHVTALEQFEAATKLDDGHAELRFRQGTSALALNRPDDATQHFAAARDFDTLRFRCDSRLNALIRRAATNRQSERILFADAEGAFATRSPQGVPGGEFFYEHVHLTFKGNHLLATTLAEQVEKLLPNQSGNGQSARAWPSEAECAQRLGWSDWSRLIALQAILARMRSAPFIDQANHEEQLRMLAQTVDQLSLTAQAGGVAAGRQACEIALTNSPDDPVLLGQLSSFQQLVGDFAGTVKSIRREIELLPSSAIAWQRLGLNLINLHQPEEAATAFRRAIALNPADAGLRLNLGQALRQSGKLDDAIAEFREAISVHPRYALGWLSLAESLEQQGHKAEAAACFQQAFAGNARRNADLAVLARFCRSRGWIDAAMTNYQQAITVNPHDAQLRVEVGQLFMAFRRITEAESQLSEAVKLAPANPSARQLYGLILGQQGRTAEAEIQFREATRIAPERLEARMDLGVALLALGKSDEALSQFETVLQRSPTNELALRYVQLLRNKSTPR